MLEQRLDSMAAEIGGENQNGEQRPEATGAVQNAPAGPQNTPEKPQKNKLKMRWRVLLCAALAAAVLSAAALGTALLRTPEDAVKSALANTVRDWRSGSNALQREQPALGLLQWAGKQARYNFGLRFEGLETAEGESVRASLLRGLAVEGQWRALPEQRAAEVQGSVILGTTELVDGYGYLSPQLAAASVPAFTDTVLAVHPARFADELLASPLARYFDAAALQNMQRHAAGLAGGGALEWMKPERLAELLARDIPGLRYERGAAENGMKTYHITAPGAQYKVFLGSVARELLLESPARAALYAAWMQEQALESRSYEECVEALLADWLRDFSPGDVTATLSVSGGRVVRVDAALPLAGDVTARLSGELPGGADWQLTLLLETAAGGKAVPFTVQAAGQNVERRYEATFALSSPGGEFTGRFASARDGAVELDWALQNGAGLGCSGAARGTASVGADGGVRVVLPQLSAELVRNGVLEYRARFAGELAVAEEPDDAPKFAATPLAQLDESALSRVEQEYWDGVQHLRVLVDDAVNAG